MIFQADTEHTEQMALAVGVGAVEAEASIRLRRLAAPGAAEVAHKGYGRLQKADLLWANTVVVGLEDAMPKAEELEDLLSALKGVDAGELAGRQGWTFGTAGIVSKVAEKTEAQRFVEGALQTAGMTVLPAMAANAGDDLEQMKEAGRQLGRSSS